jgi:hypothetical protein
VNLPEKRLYLGIMGDPCTYCPVCGCPLEENFDLIQSGEEEEENIEYYWESTLPEESREVSYFT